MSNNLLCNCFQGNSPKLLMDGMASFLRAARSGNLDKVLEYLKGSIDINTCNANGLNALHLAAKEGHVAVVSELLRRGANVNAATKKGNTALHIAALAGQEEVVRILIANGASVNVQSVHGFSALYMAAQENHDTVVRLLLANGANQSLATSDGFTPLAVALQQGHDRVVAVLLENDTKGKVRLPALHVAAKKDDCKAATLLLQNDHNPDVTSKSNFTPLHIAAHYGNENIAALLLEKNADVNFAAKHQITPLHVASKWGKVNMVSLLLDYKAKIDSATQDGLTPLHCASRSGHKSVVELLIERGAPISPKTKNGLSPLHMSAQGDHVECARILLVHKAPVDDITVDYLTPLHVASHCGHVRVAKLLLDRKAEPNARALNGFSPLHIACKKNRIKVVELLLKYGASIESTTESGLTPLHVSAFMGCHGIVIYLIQHMANPDVQTIRGETPLHLAARANQTDIIRILIRNGAQVDAKAREMQTALHIASRLGNTDIVALLLQQGAAVDAATKDQYTSLHIATKDGQEEVAAILLDHGASLTAVTKKGFGPLHLAAKYGNIKVARLLISRKAPVDAQGKNNVTPLHCAVHYDHVNIALLLLEEGASPHAVAKNGYSPLHIAARKNQMDIATTLLEYTADPNAQSKAGFSPLHLAAQEGHTDMVTLLIGHRANVNLKSKNGLTCLHLCAQNDRVKVASILVKHGANVNSQTNEGYTPLHAACHFGQMNMVRFLLQHGADVNSVNAHGYTALHQAAQQGHTQIVNLLLEHHASPNVITHQGQTALSIAQRLGYISVVETLKVVTETIISTTTTTTIEEKYKVVTPEVMHESFMSDSEDEGGEEYVVEEPASATDKSARPQSKVFTKSTEELLGDKLDYRYLTADEMKFLGDDSLPIDVTKDERFNDTFGRDSLAPITIDEELLSPQYFAMTESYVNALTPDNIAISKAPVTAGPLKWKTFLVSFMVDARGGAMRGCRHSGVRVIIPPRKAPMPMRITCRYVKRERLAHPPPLMEGEACASRILEVGPAGTKFLGPVIIEVPHFASLRGKEREIIILRSDNGETWREHTLEASEEAVLEVLNASFDGDNDVNTLDDFNSNRITRILTTDFPQYFAIITRIRQEIHAIGPEGGILSSTVVPQVQAIFPEGALTKKIKVGLQAQPIPNELLTKMLGNRVAVSPICTIEPRRRKFHKPITLTIPLPQAATRGMINQYSGETPTLRLLCSITGGPSKAQWEDVTGSTPLTFVNSCVSFTTTVSARFWLIDCREINNATKYASELYQESIHVPFMAKFVVFAKRHEPNESQLRVFCMTDDKEEKTLENQEHYTEIAKSRDVEVLEHKPQFIEFAGNIAPVTKSGEQLYLIFTAFRENRLPFTIRVKDPSQETAGRIAFMRDSRRLKSDQPHQPICNLNVELPPVKPFVEPVAVPVLLNGHHRAVEEERVVAAAVARQISLEKAPVSNGYAPAPVSRTEQLQPSRDEPDLMKEAESAEETSSDTAGRVKRTKSRSSSSASSSSSSSSDDEKREKRRREEELKREERANQYLDFLKKEDHEEMEERAASRGESVETQKELYVVKEEVAIPSDYQKEFTVEVPRQEAVNESWQSVEQDTSQVSVSSLPEDEKSEPSSVTVSSTTTTTGGEQPAVGVSITDEPKMEMIVEQREWVEENTDGTIEHIMEHKTTFSSQDTQGSVVLEGQSAQISDVNQPLFSNDDAQWSDGQAKRSAKDGADTQSQSAVSREVVEREVQSQAQTASVASVQTVPACLGHHVTALSSVNTAPTTTTAPTSSTAQTLSVDDQSLPVVYDHGDESSGDEVSDGILLAHSEHQDAVNLSDIRREAVVIANTIVEKAKEELSKQQQMGQRVQSTSLEISDEELVEKGDQDLMDKETLQYTMQQSSSAPVESSPTDDQRPQLLPTTPPTTADAATTPTTKQQVSLIEVPKEDANLVMISSSESSQQISETSSTRTTNTTNSSRPTSSEYDLTIIPEAVSSPSTTTTYQTAATTQSTNQSYVTAATSQETSYFTAQSSLSGKTSSQSMENDSSANLGELSSDASETIVLGDNDKATSCHSDDDAGEPANEFEEHYQRTSQLNTDSVEPFNCDIPLSLLKSTSRGNTGEQDNWELVPNEMSSSGYMYTLPHSTEQQAANGGKMNLTDSFVLLDDSGPQSQTQTGGEGSGGGQLEDFTYLDYGQNAFGLDKNLYTHVEVDEEGSEDNFELKKSSLVQSSPLSLASKTEAESSSTSSSLREFERIESDLIRDRADWSQSSGGGGGDFSVDSRHLESAKLEKTAATSSFSESLLDTSLADAEDNNESLNSEVSQDTITCIKNDPLEQFTTSSKVTTASLETVTKLKTFSKSLDTEHYQHQVVTKNVKDSMAEMFDPLFEEPKRVHSVDIVPSSLLDDYDDDELQSKATKVVTKMSSLTDSYDQQSSTSDADQRSGPMLASFTSETSDRSLMKDSFFALGGEPVSEAMLASVDSAGGNPVLECDILTSDSLESSMIASTGDLQCDQAVDQQGAQQPQPTISQPNGSFNSDEVTREIVQSTESNNATITTETVFEDGHKTLTETTATVEQPQAEQPQQQQQQQEPSRKESITSTSSSSSSSSSSSHSSVKHN